jgi:hypothetical protein
MSDAKYGLTLSPSGAVEYVVSGTYYAYVRWYQPKRAATYELFPRFGASDYVGAYCMQGSDTTTYFSTTRSAHQLVSAVTVSTTVGALLGTIIAAII